MHIPIAPAPLSGVLRVPSSKSMTHRELIAAALAKGETTLSGVTPSQDIEATVRILSLMGAHFTEEATEDGLTFHISGGLSPQKGRTARSRCRRVRLDTAFPYPARSYFRECHPLCGAWPPLGAPADTVLWDL